MPREREWVARGGQCAPRRTLCRTAARRTLRQAVKSLAPLRVHHERSVHLVALCRGTPLVRARLRICCHPLRRRPLLHLRLRHLQSRERLSNSS